MAPLCPLLGIFGLLYFTIVSPMIRWLLVFTYRPNFDAGGAKWPALHHIIITSLILGQFITGLSFMLKGNIPEGFIVIFFILPTHMYSRILLDKFLRPFKEAALLQTGRLSQNPESSHNATLMEREEFRRWLVDCHKASYLPTCLSGGAKNLVTVEPCCVVPLSTDENGDDE